MQRTQPSLEPGPASPVAEPVAGGCPYVGPRPFTPADKARFFGRDREALDLKYRVMAHPITLLYSMSGAGKTSLINARLIPDLRNEGCQVLPVARVSGSIGKLKPDEVANIFVFHALSSLLGTRPGDAQPPTDLTFKDVLKAAAASRKEDDEEGSLLVAVFDQFEELFTFSPDRWKDRQGFFEQLARGLEAVPDARVLLAMREDYLAEMDPYAGLLPDRLRTRFRLQRLLPESALEAVVKPLKGTGRSYAPGVAEKLVDSLLRFRVYTPAGATPGLSDSMLDDATASAASGRFATAEFVEPVQLQVVCQRLWNALGPADRLITEVHLETCGDPDRALSDYFEECVKEAAGSCGLREGVIRRWFGQWLITADRTRGAVRRGHEQTAGLPNAVVDLLQSRHIIRGEERGGARWYELSHDRFIEPIVNSNLHWESTIPTKDIWTRLEDRAAAWEAAPEAKKASFLLTRDELARADAWMKSSDASELGVSDQLKRLCKDSLATVEKLEITGRFVAERRLREVELQAARYRARSLMFALGGLVVLLIVAFIGWEQSRTLRLRAVHAANVASDWAIAAESARKDAVAGWKHSSELQQRADLAAEKALKDSNKAIFGQDAIDAAMQASQAQSAQALASIGRALDRAEKELDRSPEPQTLDFIRRSLSRVNQRSQLGGWHSEEITDIAFAPSYWGQTFHKPPTAGDQIPFPVVAFGGKEGRVELWDLGNYDDPGDDHLLIQPITPDLPDPGKKGRWISRIVFAPTGPMLAFATGDTHSVNPDDRGGAWVWIGPDSVGGAGTLRPLGENRSGPVADVTFSPRGDMIAVAGCRKRDPPGNPDRDGVWEGTVRVFDAATLKPLHDPPIVLKGPARSVAFDRRSRRLVAASGNRNFANPSLPGQVVVIDLKTWQKTEMVDCDRPTAQAVFSPDGMVVASGGFDGIGRLHDAKSGQLLATLVGHVQPISSVAFCHDGTRLVTSSYDRTARVWNPPTWSAARDRASPQAWSSQVTLVGHMAGLLWAEFNGDGSLVLTCSHDRTARIWDAQTGEPRAVLVGHEGAVNMARFRGRGFLVATAGGDKTARVWVTGQVETPRLLLAGPQAAARDTGEVPRALHGHDAALRDVEFRPGRGEGKYEALTAGADGVACLWDVSDFKYPGIRSPIRRFEPPEPRAAMTDVAFNPAGDLAATAALDGAVRVWEVDTARPVEVLRAEPGAEAGGALGVTFSPTGIYLLTSWADGQMRLFRRIGTGGWIPAGVPPWPGSAARLTPQMFDKPESFVVTPNAGLLRVRGQSGSVVVWDVEKPGKPALLKSLEAPPGGLGPVADVAVHPKTGSIAAATMGPGPAGAVVVWEGRSPYRRGGPPLGHPGGVERLAFSPDGATLATESDDGSGRLWDWPFSQGKAPRETIPGLTGPAPVLAFSDDGARLLSDGGYLATDAGATVAQVWFWKGAQRAAAPLQGPRDRVVALSVQGAGAPEVLSINREDRLQHWSITDGDPLGSCRGPNFVPTAAAVSPRGDLAVSGSDSGTLKLWQTETGTVIAEFTAPDLNLKKAHAARVSSVAFSGDGRRLVSAGDDGKACVWPVSEPTPGTIRREPLAVLPHDNLAVSAARFLDHEGHQVVTATGDRRPRRWHADAAGVQAYAFQVNLKSQTRHPLVALEEVSRKLEEVSREGRGPAQPIGAIATAVSSGDGRIFVGCGGPQNRFNLVRVFDSQTGQAEPWDYKGHSDAILDLAVSSDGSRVATASVDNTARVWLVSGKKEASFAELRGHTGNVSSVTFSPDNKYVLTISRQDGTARVWSIGGGDPLYLMGSRLTGFNSGTLNDPPGPRQYTDDVVAAAFSSDGRLLVTANGDGNGRLYCLELCGEFDDLKTVAEHRLKGIPPRAGTDQPALEAQ